MDSPVPEHTMEILAASGLVTATGSIVSHAVLIALNNSKGVVPGYEQLEFVNGIPHIEGTVVEEGALVYISGDSRRVCFGVEAILEKAKDIRRANTGIEDKEEYESNIKEYLNNLSDEELENLGLDIEGMAEAEVEDIIDGIIRQVKDILSGDNDANQQQGTPPVTAIQDTENITREIGRSA
jgi:hypothetical protein